MKRSETKGMHGSIQFHVREILRVSHDYIKHLELSLSKHNNGITFTGTRAMPTDCYRFRTLVLAFLLSAIALGFQVQSVTTGREP